MKTPVRRKGKSRPVPHGKELSLITGNGRRGLFPIVGVGASAGGLEAFSALLANLPEKTGMGFVFVQHLDPTHNSALSEILCRHTRIPVTEVTEGVAVERDHVYVIPANHELTIKDGVLHLMPRTTARGQNRPIDGFFRCLAEDAGDRAIAVILSGTASDGTAGCGSIKAAGGITFAQDEGSAKYNSMPRNAVEAGCVDFVLSPKGIADELARIGRHAYVARISTRAEEGLEFASRNDVKQLQGLFAMVREVKGIDFTHYKQGTIQHRIKRRMVVNRLEKLADYTAFVERSPNELEELYRDILIHVTGFFRDAEAFNALQTRIFPSILQNRKSSNTAIRVWIPGCSTGEEAYSLGITLMETVWEDAAKNAMPSAIVPIQIFATDISEDALDRARAGIYTEAAVSDVSPTRLQRFFARLDGGYQISKFLREVCVFAKQNVVKDPPFSNLDLISCRNLLIYLGPELQRRVISAIHYALKPKGYLMIGGAETLGVFADYFELIDKESKIYQKKSTAARLITYFTGVYSLRKPEEERAPKKRATGFSVEKEVERVLVNRFVPASIVVNSEMEIVQFRGKTGAYLEPAAGHPTFNLAKMAREGLLMDLRAAVNRAKQENITVRKQGVPMQSEGGTREVDLEVIPVRGDEDRERYFVVVFQETAPETAKSRAGRQRDKKKINGKETSVLRENERLAREVSQLRDQMRTLIEDHETTLEDFKTANEEVLSANEELQSTNEELETAKEELQSSNEELSTLNDELQTRNTELSTANNDLVNLLGNVNIPVVMVGDDLRIRRFTPLAQKLLNLLPGDIGRRLGEIRPNIDAEDLEELARDAISRGNIHEREVRETAGAWYLLRVRPYKTWDLRTEGAVISFQDIDAWKRPSEETRQHSGRGVGN